MNKKLLGLLVLLCSSAGALATGTNCHCNARKNQASSKSLAQTASESEVAATHEDMDGKMEGGFDNDYFRGGWLDTYRKVMGGELPVNEIDMSEAHHHHMLDDGEEADHADDGGDMAM